MPTWKMTANLGLRFPRPVARSTPPFVKFLRLLVICIQSPNKKGPQMRTISQSFSADSSDDDQVPRSVEDAFEVLGEPLSDSPSTKMTWKPL